MPDSSQVNFMLVGETLNAGVSFEAWLATDDALTGTPTVTASPSGLTLSNAQINTEIVEINGVSVPIGMAVLFTVTGGAACADYMLTVTSQTTIAPVQTMIAKVRLQVYAD